MNHIVEPHINGAYAILGMDLVSFSLLQNEEQIHAVGQLYRWIREALSYHSVAEREYRWSPAGDGGYVTFITTAGSQKAIDVAFSIFHKTRHSDAGKLVGIQMALHAGVIQEGDDLGRDTNVWGHGINMTARILSVSVPSQILVSKQYADLYMSHRSGGDITMGDLHWRTVKHGHQVEVMNVNRHDLGMDVDDARAMRWHTIGRRWTQTVQDYTALIHDTMRSGHLVAAVAAGRCLLQLNQRDPVWELCQRIARGEGSAASTQQSISAALFRHMPPDVLLKVIEKMQPRPLHAGEVLATLGAQENRSFFIVSGKIEVEVPSNPVTKTVADGDLIGEFSLWIPNLPRTATLRALTDGLVLELPHDEFRAVLAHSDQAAGMVYGLIKQRIIENVLKSDMLFPGVSIGGPDPLLVTPAECHRYAVGSQLELQSAAYVLFCGNVEICPKNDQRLIVQSVGIFGAEPVVGIASSIGNPDGSTAIVRRETVAVKISHTALRELQERVPAVRNAWNGLWGQRMGEIQDASRQTPGVECMPVPTRIDRV